MKYQSRAYQADAVSTIMEKLDVGKRIIYRLGTGGGKTVIAGSVAHKVWISGGRVLILAHKEFLISQFINTLNEAGLDGLDIGVIRSGVKPNKSARIQIASIQTLHNRPEMISDAPDLIIMDECHHAPARTWNEVLDRFPQTPVLGLTATPARLDGKGMGRVFHEIIDGPSDKQLTEWGYRAPIYITERNSRVNLDGAPMRCGDYSQKHIAVQINPEVVQEGVDAYETVRGTQAIFFAENIAHSKMVCERLQMAGIQARHIDGMTHPKDRQAILNAFEQRDVQVLCNADLLMEGLDVPACEVVIIHRHTRSVVRYLQMVGRGVRPGEGKVMKLIDLAGNVDLHGHPDDDRVWALTMGQPVNLDSPAKPNGDGYPPNMMEMFFQLVDRPDDMVRLGLCLGMHPTEAKGWAEHTTERRTALAGIYK